MLRCWKGLHQILMIGASRLKTAHRWLLSSIAEMVAFWQRPSGRGGPCFWLFTRLCSYGAQEGGIGATDVHAGWHVRVSLCITQQGMEFQRNERAW